MPSNAPKGKLLITQLSKRLVGIAASTVLLSFVSTGAHAQAPIDVLTGTTFTSDVYGTGTSTYKFTGSMILNSIGFVTNGNNPYELYYTIKNGDPVYVNPASLIVDASGYRWHNISPLSMVENDIVTVTTDFSYGTEVVSWVRASVTQPSSSTNVSYQGFLASDEGPNPGLSIAVTNSNLRVSNPSSNVAPEPGSFALALTGGAALIGICIRRRRNAA